jgi:hypothetical protein
MTEIRRFGFVAHGVRERHFDDLIRVIGAFGCPIPERVGGLLDRLSAAHVARAFKTQIIEVSRRSF